MKFLLYLLLVSCAVKNDVDFTKDFSLGRALNNTSKKYSHLKQLGTNYKETLVIFYYRKNCRGCADYLNFLQDTLNSYNDLAVVYQFEKNHLPQASQLRRGGDHQFYYEDTASNAINLTGILPESKINNVLAPKAGPVFNLLLFDRDGHRKGLITRLGRVPSRKEIQYFLKR